MPCELYQFGSEISIMRSGNLRFPGDSTPEVPSGPLIEHDLVLPSTHLYGCSGVVVSKDIKNGSPKTLKDPIKW